LRQRKIVAKRSSVIIALVLVTPLNNAQPWRAFYSVVSYMTDNVISLHGYQLAKQRQEVKAAVLNALQDYVQDYVFKPVALFQASDECDADFKLRLKAFFGIQEKS
jgi:hypothetical protein